MGTHNQCSEGFSMPARRKPTAILAANGSFKKDPRRWLDRQDEPIPEGPLGGPPEDWLEGAEAGNSQCQAWIKIWGEVSKMAQFGVISSMDRMHTENICYLEYRIRRMARGYMKWSTSDFSELNKHLGQIGCIPSERSRVKGQTKTAEVAGEWAELAAEQQKREPVQ
jgi:hypothetical protein